MPTSIIGGRPEPDNGSGKKRKADEAHHGVNVGNNVNHTSHHTGGHTSHNQNLNMNHNQNLNRPHMINNSHSHNHNNQNLGHSGHNNNITYHHMNYPSAYPRGVGMHASLPPPTRIVANPNANTNVSGHANPNTATHPNVNVNTSTNNTHPNAVNAHTNPHTQHRTAAGNSDYEKRRKSAVQAQALTARRMLAKHILMPDVKKSRVNSIKKNANINVETNTSIATTPTNRKIHGNQRSHNQTQSTSQKQSHNQIPYTTKPPNPTNSVMPVNPSPPAARPPAAPLTTKNTTKKTSAKTTSTTTPKSSLLSTKPSTTPKSSLLSTKPSSSPPTTLKITTTGEISKTNATLADAVAATVPTGHFAVNSLAPLRSKAGSKKKWVELYCKGSKQVVCCFRGHHDAAIALKLDRKIVKKMCDKNGADIPVSETFALMYASNKSRAPAYHYGIHEEDFVYKSETYLERMGRFNATYLREREQRHQQEEEGDVDPPPPTNEITLGSLQPKPSKAIVIPESRAVGLVQGLSMSGTGNGSAGEVTKTNQAVILKAERASVMSMDANKSKLVTVVPRARLQTGLLTKSEHEHLCIFCQDMRADVVFEPCHHSVLCGSCFEKHFVGKRFCPLCRASIRQCLKPDLVKFVRPRIFSAFSFVDA